MALKNKIVRERRPTSFAPPPAKGEVVLNVRSAEPKEKKKSQRQIEKEALDEHMKQWQENFEAEQKERMKLLDQLPF